jgi:Ser/Thr protein kinase RdoA (MazF antagonist)
MTGLHGAVAAAYALGDLSIVEDLDGWGGRLRLRCRTAAGRDVFVKEKAPYLDGDDWHLHLQVHGASARAGGPVPRLLTTVDGEPGVTVEGRLFEVQEWVAGRPLGATVPDARLLGRAIALFHRSTRAMPPGTTAQPACRRHWSPDDVPTLLHAIARYCRPRLPESTPEMRTLDALARAVRDRPGPARADTYLHGDTALANAVRADDGTVVLIDLDDARWGDRLFDLAHAVAVAGTVVPAPHGLRTRWDEDVAAAVVTGYAEVSPLTAGDLRRLTPCLTVATVAAGISELELDDPEFALRDDLAGQLENLMTLVRDVPSLEPSRSLSPARRKEVRHA